MSVYISALVIIVITRIPLLHKYVKILNTFIHEFGHALFSMITFGGVHRIKLNSDTSGYAITTSKWWIGRVITAFAGYPFSTLFSSFMLYLLYKHQAIAVLWTITIILVLSIILWLRDLLSLAWSLPITIIFILALRYSLNVDWLMYILMVIILIDSISSTFTVAKLSIRDHTNAGDASSLSKLTFIPSQVWGLIFIVCSLSITIYTFLAIIGFMPDFYGQFIDFLLRIYALVHNLLKDTI